MYYSRSLKTHEALFVSRAQQRIASLGAELADEFDRNDVTNYKAELILELEYAIKVLYSTDLVWTADEIQMMIDYYTQVGKLAAIGFRSIVFSPTPKSSSCDCDTIITMITKLETKVDSNYSYLYNLALQIDADYKAADVAIYDYINNLVLGSTATWSAEHTAEINIGGVKVGDTYPIGSPLEEALKQLTTQPAVVENFTLDTWVDLVEANDTLTVTTFSWDFLGLPVGLKLSDSEGILVDEPVTGSSHTPTNPIDYPFVGNKTITWTLTGDNIDPITIEVTSVYRTYFDKEATANDNEVTVTEAKILAAATTALQRTHTNVSMPVNTSKVEQGFIAIPKIQSASDYTKWRVNDNNNSTISVGEFIRPPSDVTVSGVVYRIYKWGYRSPLIATLKLER